MQPELVLVPSTPVSITPKFATIQSNLYRSSKPRVEDLSHLAALSLTSVVILCPQKLPPLVSNFLLRNKVRLEHVGAEELIPDDSPYRVADKAIKRALEYVLDSANLPALVCDLAGIHEIGVFVGVLRRIQSWNLCSVLHEYRSFALHRSKVLTEQYIELFDLNTILIPDNVPDWFRHYAAMEEEERKELDALWKNGKVDENGALVDRRSDVAKYEIYRFSSVAPLNSVKGGKKPRILFTENTP